MTLKSDAKFKEKLACGFKYNMRNMVNFHPTPQKSKNFTLVGYFCPKYMKSELKKYRRFIFHSTEQWCKICINPDRVVSKMAWRIGWTFIRALKSEKLFTDGLFLFKAYNVSVRKFQRNYVMTLKDDAKFKGKLICGLKNDIRNSVSFHASSQKSQNLHFDWILFSKAYKDLDEKVQNSYVS